MKQNRGEPFQILFFKSSAGSSYNKSFSTLISIRIRLFILPSLRTDQTFNKAEKYMLLKVNDKMLCFRYILKFLPKSEFFFICNKLLITFLQNTWRGRRESGDLLSRPLNMTSNIRWEAEGVIFMFAAGRLFGGLSSKK